MGERLGMKSVFKEGLNVINPNALVMAAHPTIILHHPPHDA
jgi:hypothetical protein